MTGATPAPARASTARDARAAFLEATAEWFVVLLIIRLFEFARIRSTLAGLPGLAGALGNGLLADVRFAATSALILAIPVATIARWSASAALTVHRTLLVALAVATAALSQYFTTTGALLGADLWGYTLADITTTVGASAGGMGPWLVLVVTATVTWVVTGYAISVRLPGSSRFRAASAAGVVMVAFVAGFVGDAPVNDRAAALAENKSAYFVRRSVRLAVDDWEVSTAGLSGYPLYHAAPPDDPLGALLRPAPAPPNIVFIVVEGLGRDFVGPRASWRGFTPFLDSLEASSLSWENALSATGRTFGVMPSLLGSLPFGDAGFMELAGEMPPHLSLIQLLRDRGYETRYFTGTSGHFDFADAFLDRQNIDRVLDENDFGAGYARQPGANGFSWGYPDAALFRRAAAVDPASPGGPRLDVFQTITTHEPFVPPDSARWAAAFERRLATLALPASDAATYRAYANVFATLLYTDDAIRGYFDALRARGDFARTIVVVTGDHRLVPVPEGNRLSRFRVPLIVASPLVLRPRRFLAIVSHLDVTPSFVALLRERYRLPMPDSVAWLGAPLDTAATPRATHGRPLMRTKNELDDWIQGTHFLSRGQLFTVDSALAIAPVVDRAARDSLGAALARFRAVNRYVTRGSKLYPPGKAPAAPPVAGDSIWRARGFARKSPEDVFAFARDAAFRKEYALARAVGRRLLRDFPAYHDARVLVGRTFAWETQFDSARAVLNDLARRAPRYRDGWLARGELERWAGNNPRARAIADSALALFPGDTAFLRLRRQVAPGAAR